jgi:hypothetical protein
VSTLTLTLCLMATTSVEATEPPGNVLVGTQALGDYWSAMWGREGSGGTVGGAAARLIIDVATAAHQPERTGLQRADNTLCRGEEGGGGWHHQM